MDAHKPPRKPAPLDSLAGKTIKAVELSSDTSAEHYKESLLVTFEDGTTLQCDNPVAHHPEAE